mmetsp:Transcript_19017/g.44127  ORF Transcript_19017/g.44127 Transcript_19017/m.44127 type:complete len:293 (+) Transcript_19017:498-1376(+)
MPALHPRAGGGVRRLVPGAFVLRPRLFQDRDPSVGIDHGRLHPCGGRLPAPQAVARGGEELSVPVEDGHREAVSRSEGPAQRTRGGRSRGSAAGPDLPIRLLHGRQGPAGTITVTTGRKDDGEQPPTTVRADGTPPGSTGGDLQPRVSGFPRRQGAGALPRRRARAALGTTGRRGGAPAADGRRRRPGGHPPDSLLGLAADGGTAAAAVLREPALQLQDARIRDLPVQDGDADRGGSLHGDLFRGAARGEHPAQHPGLAEGDDRLLVLQPGEQPAFLKEVRKRREEGREGAV